MTQTLETLTERVSDLELQIQDLFVVLSDSPEYTLKALSYKAYQLKVLRDTLFSLRKDYEEL